MAVPIVLPVVIAGGVGTRLWPISRKSLPKQFCSIFGDQSLFQKTLARVSNEVFHTPIVITNGEYRFLVSDQLATIKSDAEIYLEPFGRNTAPAVIAAAFIAQEKHEDALVAVLPADHLIVDKQAFIDALMIGITDAIAGKLVTFGVQPDSAETGYGYIEVKESRRQGVLEVLTFHEKPDAERANEYTLSGRHLWNTGIFLFKPSTMIELAEKFQSETVRLVRSAVNSIEVDLGYKKLPDKFWSRIRNQSVDYAICEHATNIACVPFSHYWNDLGDWKSFAATRKQDVNGNVLSANTTEIDCKNTFLLSKNNRIHLAALGVDNIVAVVTEDAVLVANKDRSQEVKNLVESLETNNVHQSSWHRKDYRPWGNFEALNLESNYQLKKLQVKPGGKLSLQSHQFRSEHWVVVKGRATVVIDGNKFYLEENQSTYIAPGQKHSLANDTDDWLTIIEVQVGSYLGEDDIVRYEDIYNRDLNKSG